MKNNKLKQMTTSRNIKTLLFASLIAAMILPFSMMDNAEAATKCSGKKSCPKDMKVRAGYKVPKYVFGVVMYDTYWGHWSSGTIGSTIQSERSTTYPGVASGIVPVCQTGSTHKPVNAVYNLNMYGETPNESTIIPSNPTQKSSFFVWYDGSDTFSYPIQNNLPKGTSFECTVQITSLN